MSLNKQADFVAYLKDADVKESNLESEVQLIHDIYKRLDNMEVKVPLDDRTQLDDVMDWKEKYHNSCQDARVYIREQAEAYEDKLANQIASLEEECGVVTGSLNREPFTNIPEQATTNMDTQKLMDALQAVKEKKDVLESEATELSRVKSLFDGVEYNSSAMQTLTMVLEQKLELWGFTTSGEHSYKNGSLLI